MQLHVRRPVDRPELRALPSALRADAVQVVRAGLRKLPAVLPVVHDPRELLEQRRQRDGQLRAVGLHVPVLRVVDGPAVRDLRRPQEPHARSVERSVARLRPVRRRLRRLPCVRAPVQRKRLQQPQHGRVGADPFVQLHLPQLVVWAALRVVPRQLLAGT